jgi:2-methylaconitate cis-trans-isomerase PrpF
MNHRRLPAAFMRGGTSKAIMFHAKDLPADRAEWDPIFLAALGSPDQNGRQINGMGGGISSLSKVCVIAPSARSDADVDYTFAQVLIQDPKVDYSGNCGNMSSAVGPFAVDEGIVRARDGKTTVRIYQTNTRKIIHSTFDVTAGAATGKLLPTGNAVDATNTTRRISFTFASRRRCSEAVRRSALSWRQAPPTNVPCGTTTP